MMDGEYGNIEFWIANHTWTDSANRSEVCRLYGTANCIIIDHFSAFEAGLVAPFLYVA